MVNFCICILLTEFQSNQDNNYLRTDHISWTNRDIHVEYVEYVEYDDVSIFYVVNY